LHYAGLRGRLKAYILDREFLFYVGVIATAIVLVTALLAVQYDLGSALRKAAFQVVSITTTTGYTTDNFNLWPIVVRLGLVVLMFFGGCAGSTGGGMKSIRVFLMIKHAGVEMRRLLHPQAVIPVRLGDRPVNDRVIQSVQAFMFLYIAIFVVASLMMTGVLLASPGSIEPGDQPSAVSSDTTIVTAVSSVAATLNNIGPGLGHVGPGDARAYSWVPPLGKIILVMCMLTGRLEVFTVVLLFVPWFYRQ